MNGLRIIQNVERKTIDDTQMSKREYQLYIIMSNDTLNHLPKPKQLYIYIYIYNTAITYKNIYVTGIGVDNGTNLVGSPYLKRKYVNVTAL